MRLLPRMCSVKAQIGIRMKDARGGWHSALVIVKPETVVARFEVSDRLAELIGKSLREICGGLTASERKLRHANLKLTLQDVLK